MKKLFSLELIGELLKTLFGSILKGLGFLIVTFLGIICVCNMPFHLFVEVDAKPLEDVQGQIIEASNIVDEPVIVNNCDGTSTHKIQGQTISTIPLVRPIPEKNTKIPIFNGIGFQGLSADISSSVLDDVHIDQILKEHDSYKRIDIKPIYQVAGEYLAKDTLENLAGELSQRLSIGEITTPDSTFA